MGILWQVAFVLLLLFVLAEGVAILALARCIGLLQVRLGPEPAALRTSDGLAIFEEAPGVTGFDVRRGQPVTLDVGHGRWGLVFVSVSCGTCRDLIRATARVGRDRGWGARIVVISQGTHEQNEVLSRPLSGLMLLSDQNGDVLKAYAVERTPYAFLVEDGRIQAKGIVNHRDHLEALLEGRMSERTEEVWQPVGKGSPQVDGAAPAVQVE